MAKPATPKVKKSLNIGSGAIGPTRNEVVTSARNVDPKAAALADKIPPFMISADSHATEPDELWNALTPKLRECLPLFIGRNRRPDGATNPKARVLDQDKDGVAAEVLYPDQGLGTFAAEQDVQEAAFGLYNDWLADFCKENPKRLFGITAVPCYDIDKAIKEMQRGRDLGLHGALIWQVPHPKLPLSSPHYERLWAAAEELGEPINLHILTGFNYTLHRTTDATERVRASANTKTLDTYNALFDILFFGVFDRHPKLKLGLIESEIGWAPFILQQWDYYYERAFNATPEMANFHIKRKPSEIFRDHVFATFMDDYVGSRSLAFWGEKNCMWSSDYPHPNMTWPNSRAFAAKQIADLPRGTQESLLSKNVIELYKLDV